MSELRRGTVPPGARSGSREQQELDAVVMLLRSLPDPEPPPDLGERILTEIRRREARPRVLRGAFRVARPAAGAAVAAGLAALAATTWMEPPANRGLEILREMPARPVEDAGIASSVVLPAPAVSFTRMSDPLLHAPRPRDARQLDDARAQGADALDQRLDHLLNSLLLDPPSFYDWLASHDNHRLAIARLADRAAVRGDAADVALQLRQKAPDHAMTATFAEELFRATVSDYLSKNRP